MPVLRTPSQSLILDCFTTRRTKSAAPFSDDLLAVLAPALEVVLLLTLPELLHRSLLEVVVAESDFLVAARTGFVGCNDIVTHGCSGVEV
jgi:hypothetical protein